MPGEALWGGALTASQRTSETAALAQCHGEVEL